MHLHDPLLMGQSHNADYVMHRKNRESLRHLVTHIKNQSLKDDIVCKLSVPSADAEGAIHEIEVAISDVIVMIAMATQNSAMSELIRDTLDEVRRNSMSQSSMEDSLNRLQGLVNKTFSPVRITQQIVADITRLPK